jgi:acyl transferase domain-containing protein
MRGDKATLTALDGAARFDPAVHLRGDVAAPLIYAASYLDFLSLDRERFEVVAVTGNSMGWYTALACAGAVSGEHGAIANAMGVNSQQHEPGGQAVLVLAGADWRVDPAVRVGVMAAMARHGVLPSIMLGGMLVVAGPDAALDAMTVDVAALLPRAPLRLAGHGPFHTPLMGASSAAARAGLPVEWFGAPQVPLIDGCGNVWRRFETRPEALWGYTFGAQILAPYDFTAAMTVALREFAPDRIVLLGPGETLGGAIGQVLVALDWLDIGGKEGFAAWQGSDALLVGMGRPAQRGIVTS